jgi:hypothetical protein
MGITTERKRERYSNSEKDKRGGKKIFLLSFLPPNLLVIFISFYWLIFNTIYFILLFIFASSFVIFALFFYFVMVMAISIHLTDMPLDEDCMMYQRSLAEEGEA